MLNEKADFVHVSGNHDNGPVALLVGDQVAESVNFHRVDVPFQRIGNDGAHTRFVSWNTCRFA